MSERLTGFEKNFVTSWEDWDYSEYSFMFLDVKLTNRLHQICKCMGMPAEGIVDIVFDLEHLTLTIDSYSEREDERAVWSQVLPVQLGVF